MSTDTEPIVQDGNQAAEDNPADVESEEDEEELSFTNAPFFHPSRLPYKLFVLIFVCLLAFGSYYCFDNPTALQKQILTDMDVNLSDYTILYSVYSWPNVILSVLGGVLVDAVFGIRLGAIIFSLILAVGQVVFALGAFVNQYWVMILGRFIFGLGGENLAVCQNLYSAIWYKGSMLNMAFGIELSVARLGSSANLWTMQPIYNMVHPYGTDQPGYVGLGITLFIGAIICLFSFACATILMFLDRHGKKALKRKERQGQASWADLKAVAEVRHFPLQMWIICGICVFYYITVFPFVGIAQTFYVQKYSLDAGSANTVNSLVYLISLFASPILGFLIDRSGKNIFWILLGCLLTTTAHVLLAFFLINPFFCTALMGLSYSILASSLWPLVAYVMPEEKLGTAFGVMQAVQNIGLAIMPLIAGIIVDSKGYLIQEIIFLLCLFAAISFTLVLWIVDGGRGGELNMTTSDRQRLADSKRKEA